MNLRVEDCADCPFCTDNDEEDFEEDEMLNKCMLTGNPIDICNDTPDWCPLRKDDVLISLEEE